MKKWEELTIYEQMANIGSEVSRMFSWQKKKKAELAQNAAERALELVAKTRDDSKNIQYMAELRTLQNLISDFADEDSPQPKTNPESLKKYLLAYGLAVRA